MKLKLLSICLLLLFWSNFINAQTVTLNPIPQINCPNAPLNICGTFTFPNATGPFNISVEFDILSSTNVYSGGLNFPIL